MSAREDDLHRAMEDSMARRYPGTRWRYRTRDEMTEDEQRDFDARASAWQAMTEEEKDEYVAQLDRATTKAAAKLADAKSAK